MICNLLSLRGLRITATSVPVAASMVMGSAGANAQESASDSGPQRAVSVVPRVSITETLTDNVRLSSVGQQAELITEISPGISINIEGARVKGYFDYSLNRIFYAQNSSPTSTQNALNTFGTLEAVDNWAFVDFSGSISQQAVSAFGTPSIDNTSVNANRAEVSNYRISPYVRGRFGDTSNYEARYSRAVTSSDAAAASGVTTVDGVVKISGGSAFRNLGWSAGASRQSIDYSTGRPTEADRLILGLSYLITPQLRVSANGGREANNYTSVDKKSYGTSGFGVSWSPSVMTTLSASRDHHSFGNTHSLSFEHRTPRTAWKYTDSKDVSATPTQTGIASLAISDLLYGQYVSAVKNPVSRAQFNATLSNFGINPNAPFTFGFLTSTLSLQRRQDLSFALLGVRDTVTFVATRSLSTQLDTVSTALDDFNTSSLIRLRGFSISYVHRLTPDYSLGILASQQNTSGVSSLQDTTLRFINVSVSGKVGKRTAASVGVRRVVSSSSTVPYVENAITCTLTVQF